MTGLIEIVGTIYGGSVVVLLAAGVAWHYSGRFRRSMVGEHAA